MDDLIFKYPHTDLHSVNLDYILKIVRENAGLHLEISGNQLILKTADNTIISAVTIPYATEAGSASSANSAAYASSAGQAASATYAASAGSASTATNATNAAHATAADTATSAASATNATNADHATAADTATYATSAGTAASADYATTTGSVEHAEKAIETVSLNGNYFRFVTHDGTAYEIAAPYAVKASRDASANYITQTYFADVIDDSGVLKFKNAQGDVIKSLTPSIAQAQTDSYGNTIADYVKDISVSSNSDYVTIDHGTGTADTLTIHYSETAWKDTNGNVIKNTYIKRLEIITDPNDGHKKLVAYNGDNPEAELFRIPVESYYAQTAGEANHAASADYATSAGTAAEATHAASADTASNGDVITDYMKEVVFNDTQYGVQNLVFNSGSEEDIYSVNLFERSKILIGFFDKDKTNPDDIYSLAVNGQVTYTVDPNTLGWYKCVEVDDILKEGVVIGYINASDQMIMRCPIFYSNGYYYISGFDHTSSSFKVFMLWQGTLATDLVVKRVL